MGGEESTRDSVDTLVLDILEAVDDGGESPDHIQLRDHIDVEALATVIDSTQGEFVISFRVDDLPITVTREGVRPGVLLGELAHTRGGSDEE